METKQIIKEESITSENHLKDVHSTSKENMSSENHHEDVHSPSKENMSSESHHEDVHSPSKENISSENHHEDVHSPSKENISSENHHEDTRSAAKQTINENETSDNYQEDLHSPTKLPAYLLALRPWSFSASSMPVLIGYTLAYKSLGTHNILSFIITTVTALAVHGAGNVVNSYYDFVKGIDSKKSDDRILVDDMLSKDEITFLGVVLYIIGCLGFFILTIIAPVKLEYLAVVYFGGLSSSFLYTGGIGFKYIALGDLLVLIIFGPITVLFSYMVQTGNLNWGTIFYAVPLALNTEAILHSNNTRDMDSDRKAGIVTLAIIIGQTASEVLYAFFLFSPFTLFIIWGLKYSCWLFLPLITLPSAFTIESDFRIGSKDTIPRRTAKLNVYIGFLYAFGVFLSNSKDLPFID